MRSFIKRIERSALLAALVVCATSGFSQTFPARLYSTLDGLPSNSIFDITQDHEGLIWFVTSKGIVTYDGQKWNKYADSLRLPNSATSYIKTMEDGSIWTAGQDNKGLVIRFFKNKKWQAISSPNELEILTTNHPFAFEVTFTGDDYLIWIATRSKLYSYSVKKKNWTESSFSSRINTIKIHEGIVYLCSDSGLYRYSNEKIELIKPDVPYKNTEVLTVTFQDNKMYVLGYKWFAIVENNKTITYWDNLPANNRPMFNKYSLIVDGDHRIFYNCNSPMFQFDPQTGISETLETENKIQSARSVVIFKDAEKNIWVGGHRGLFRFNQLRFKNYSKSTGLEADEVSSIIQLANGQIVLANATTLNYIQESKVGKRIKLPYHLYNKGGRHCRIMDMIEDKDHVLYLALGPAGLCKFENNKFTTLEDPLNPNIDFNAVEIWQNKVYTSSPIGIYEITTSGLKQVSKLRGTRNLKALNEKELIASTKEGFYRISSSDTIRINSGLRDLDNVYDVTIWNGNLLAATAHGLMKVEGNKILNERFIDVDLPFYSFMQDSNNNLWMGTGDGMVKLDSAKFRKYNRSHGLLGSETNRGALIQDKSGNIWVGTEQGASVYTEDEDLTLNFIPKLSIPFIKDGNGTLLSSDSLNEIPYHLNTVEIYYRGVSFISEEKNSYRYKLQGIDDEWRIQNNNINTSVRYTTLKSGTYTFIVQTRLEQGEWSEPVTSTFIIQKPYYAQLWFLILMVFILLGIFFGIYQFRFYYLIRRQQHLKKLIKARTMEISERTDEISKLNLTLEQKVRDRTQELEDRNQRLSEYAFINAHLLRAPLNRIQSLAILMEETREMEALYLNILKESTSELDDVIYSINSTLREEKEDAKAQNYKAS